MVSYIVSRMSKCYCIPMVVSTTPSMVRYDVVNILCLQCTACYKVVTASLQHFSQCCFCFRSFSIFFDFLLLKEIQVLNLR